MVQPGTPKKILFSQDILVQRSWIITIEGFTFNVCKTLIVLYVFKCLKTVIKLSGTTFLTLAVPEAVHTYNIGCQPITLRILNSLIQLIKFNTITHYLLEYIYFIQYVRILNIIIINQSDWMYLIQRSALLNLTSSIILFIHTT